jgi:hypothetical protein
MVHAFKDERDKKEDGCFDRPLIFFGYYALFRKVPALFR